MKLKTHKATAKRIIKITKKGKILCRPLSAQHRVKGKSKRVLSRRRKFQLVSRADKKRIKRLLPYGVK